MIVSRCILILFAHPALRKSRVNRRLLAAARTVAGVPVRDLYEEYPDFMIDLKREQDDAAKSLEIAETVQRHYPDLHFMARANGRIHACEFLKRGITDVWRETLDSSLEMSIAALHHLGHRAYEARRAARRFRAHDEATVHELVDLWGDEPKYIAAVRQRMEILNEARQADAANLMPESDEAWDTQSLAREVRGEHA